jgi:hypothetical protein
MLDADPAGDRAASFILTTLAVSTKVLQHRLKTNWSRKISRIPTSVPFCIPTFLLEPVLSSDDPQLTPAIRPTSPSASMKTPPSTIVNTLKGGHIF